MSKRYIRKHALQEIRKLSAFDYLKNYQPDMLIKNGRTDYYHREHDSLHFSNGGHKVKAELPHWIIL